MLYLQTAVLHHAVLSYGTADDETGCKPCWGWGWGACGNHHVTKPGKLRKEKSANTQPAGQKQKEQKTATTPFLRAHPLCLWRPLVESSPDQQPLHTAHVNLCPPKKDGTASDDQRGDDGEEEEEEE